MSRKGEKAKQWRPWQFSIRRLLITTSGICVLLGLIVLVLPGRGGTQMSVSIEVRIAKSQPFRFTVRELLLATVITGLVVGWWSDHQRMQSELLHANDHIGLLLRIVEYTREIVACELEVERGIYDRTPKNNVRVEVPQTMVTGNMRF